MRVISKLSQDEFDALLNLSERERRDPRDQAALIIRRELERLGYIEAFKANEVTNETQTA